MRKAVRDMNVTEEPVPKDMMEHIIGCANDALLVLGKDFTTADPATVVRAIDDFAYRWQRGDQPPKKIVKDGNGVSASQGRLRPLGRLTSRGFPPSRAHVRESRTKSVAPRDRKNPH